MESISFITNPFFLNVILPFLLIFVVVYAILEKSNILGTGKKNANLIVALVIGFIFIGVQSFVGFTLKIIPIVAIFLIILLCYFLIFGFIGISGNKGIQIALGIIFGLAFIASILWATGLLAKITASSINSDVIGVIVLIIILGGAIALTLSTSKPASTA